MFNLCFTSYIATFKNMDYYIYIYNNSYFFCLFSIPRPLYHWILLINFSS